MIFQDGKDGGGQDTAVGMPQGHRNHGHVDIQQQIIMTGDGVKMQVVRVVSFGGSRGAGDLPAQIQEQIKNIENALIGDITNMHEADNGNEHDPTPEENDSKQEENGAEPNEEDAKADESDGEKSENEEKEKDGEEGNGYNRDINPRGKVLQRDLEEENPSENNENEVKTGNAVKDGEENEKDSDNFQKKIESLVKDINVVESELEKVKEMTETENENAQKKVKIKVVDVNPENSQESSDDDDYDVVHSKTKRIKIEGIPNQAKKPDPPKSIFKNLGPSRQRYTILERDEL